MGRKIVYGVPSEEVDAAYEYQHGRLDCWASSLVLIFRLHGFNVDQLDLMRWLMGLTPDSAVPDMAATDGALNKSLNRGFTSSGKRYRVQAIHRLGTPAAGLLIDELRDGRPVLLSHFTRHRRMNHAVVITAVEVVEFSDGRQAITRVVVRDPRNGAIIYNGPYLAKRMSSTWTIEIWKHTFLGSIRRLFTSKREPRKSLSGTQFVGASS